MRKYRYRNHDFFNIRHISPNPKFYLNHNNKSLRSNSSNTKILKNPSNKNNFQEFEDSLKKNGDSVLIFYFKGGKYNQKSFIEKFKIIAEQVLKQDKNKEKSQSEKESQRSSQNSKSSKQSSIPEELKPLYKVVRSEIIVDDEQLAEDALQFEAFYYQLACFGLHTSPMLSLPPIVAYFNYSLLLNNFEDIIGLMKKDQILLEFLSGLKEGTSNKLIQQGQLQSTEYQESLYKWMESHQAIFLSIIPKNQDFNLIDQKIVLEDYKAYKDLSIQQKNEIIESLDESTFIWRKNNILIASLRFVFKKTDKSESLNIRIPVSEFSKIKYTDMIDLVKEIQDFENQNQREFDQFQTSSQPPHSEKAMLTFILLDSIKDKQIFKLLEKQLKNIDQHLLILELIQIEITSKNRMCPSCVHTFKKFPTKQYCEKLRTNFHFQLKDSLFLVVLTQYLNEPKFSSNKGRLFNNKSMSEQSSEQKSKGSQQDLNLLQNQTKFYTMQKELGPTGLLSRKLFQKRYCKIDQQIYGELSQFNCKIKAKIEDVEIKNTFFLSTDFEEVLEKLKQYQPETTKKQNDTSQQKKQEPNQKINNEEQQQLQQNQVNQSESGQIDAKNLEFQQVKLDEQKEFSTSVAQELSNVEMEENQQIQQQMKKLDFDFQKLNQQYIPQGNQTIQEYNQQIQLTKQHEGSQIYYGLQPQQIEKGESIEQQQQTEMKYDQKNQQQIQQQSKQLESQEPEKQNQQQTEIGKQKRKNRLLINFKALLINLKIQKWVGNKNTFLKITVVEDCKIEFLTQLIFSYCENVKTKNFNQFQIILLDSLIEYVVKLFNPRSHDPNFFHGVMEIIIPSGIMFNKEINSELLLKDYIFFQQSVKLKEKLKKKNFYSNDLIHNEFSIQIFEYHKDQQSWQNQNIQNQNQEIIRSCKHFSIILNNQFSNLSQSTQLFLLVICTLYEINNDCKHQIVTQLSQSFFSMVKNVKIHFCSLNLTAENASQQIQQISGNQQNDNKQIIFENFNLLNVQNFLNRYIFSNTTEKKSLNLLRIQNNSLIASPALIAKSMTKLSNVKCKNLG